MTALKVVLKCTGGFMLATVNDLQTEILKHCTDKKRDVDDLITLCNASAVSIGCEIYELLKEGKLKKLPDPLAQFYSRYTGNVVFLTIKD